MRHLKFLFAVLNIMMVAAACRPSGSNLDLQSNCELQPRRTTSVNGLGAGMGVLSTDFGSDEIAQTFIPSTPMRLERIALRLRPPVRPPEEFNRSTLTLIVDGTVAGMPAERELARATLPVATVTRDALYEFALNTDAQLEANKQYWFRLNADYAPSPVNFIIWEGSLENPYGDGLAMYKIGNRFVTTGIGTSRDLFFQLRCGS